MATIEVTCRPAGDGWTCEVEVVEGSSRSSHTVRVRAADLERYAPGRADPAALVRASFGFLLDHEPKESILRSLDLPVIGRYFPDYESEIATRLAREKAEG